MPAALQKTAPLPEPTASPYPKLKAARNWTSPWNLETHGPTPGETDTFRSLREKNTRLKGSNWNLEAHGPTPGETDTFRSLREKNTRLKGSNATVNRLPIEESSPLWLYGLVVIQRGFATATLVLAVLPMVLYGYTVAVQYQWDQQYQQLESLRYQKRQLIAATEGLKAQVAQQAKQSSAQLSLQKPISSIFLQPADQRPQKALPTSAATLVPEPTLPLAY